jgi:hypothetical protein
MAGNKLIVIRLVPPAAVAANPLGSTPPSFTDYLAQNGGLSIAAYDLSYGNPADGTLVGTAIYKAPSTLPQTSSSLGFATVPTAAAYSAGTGIVQELTQQPGDLILDTSPFYQFESVATAIIEFTPAGAGAFFENLRLVATWVTGGAQAFSITQDYYDVVLQPGPTPSPDTVVTTTYTVQGSTVIDTTDAWTALPPSLYLTVPPPATPGATNFTLPSNGTAPPFDKLQTAIQAVLAIDPGGAAPDAGKLTFAQCQNIAYEIVWSQQPPLPVPPDPIENLYTNPPNDGSLMNGSTPNPDEGDRQQFQAQLTGYYALADATAARLTNFVFSYAVAVACEELSLATTKVYLEFPANPAEPNSQDAEIILGNVGTSTSNFGVPAAYFYALTASMPASMLAQQRYSLALDENLQQMLADMTSAYNAGVITDVEAFSSPGVALPAINMAQAVRRMQALNVPSSSSLNPLPLDATVQPIVTDWLKFAATDPSPSSGSYQPSDELVFWTTEDTGQPAGLLELVLWALTQGYIIPAPTNASLASVITSTLPLAPPSVASLVAVANAQWTAFFTAHPAWLPPVAQSGNLAARISNFLAYLQKFFSVSDVSVASTIYYVTTIDANPADTFGGKVLTFASTTGVVPGMSISGAVSAITTIAGGTIVASPPPPNPTPTAVTLSKPVTGDVPAGTTITFTSNYATSGAIGWLLLEAPSTDWIGSCLTAYGGGFTFGSGFNLSTLQTAAGTVFPNDSCAQAWLVTAMLAIDALYQILIKAALPVTPNFEFSIVEALYARGFTSAADVTELSSSDFQTALTGTVAYDSATALFAAAQLISPNTPPSSSGGTFLPINPDGLLTNCIPAPCRSPLGPIEYLHEVLQVSPSGTCDDPFAAPAAGQSTLGAVMAQRRGPLGQLAASCANLETPLPLVDIVNECLEFMASAAPATNGTVYNTSPDAVAGYALCKKECPPEEKPHSLCHDAAELLCALPEYSTPGTPVASSNPLESNQNVEPLVWNILKSDFSACCLPYSQALDVNRTYLRHLSSCRFEVMRTFRKCITEFVLDPDSQPTGFENYLWRYPVRIDIAIEYLGISPEEFQQVFQGVWPQSCGPALDRNPVGRNPASLQVAQTYGFSATADGDSSQQTAIQVPEFLRRTCLSYCEFLELWRSQFVVFNDGGDERGNFPDCEPCCLEQHWLQFPGQNPNQPPDPNQPVGTPVAGTQAAPQAGNAQLPPQAAAPPPVEQELGQLWVFIRLWRKLKDVCNAGYSFAQLRDICDVLQLFTGGSVNPEFIRQLAAFQMLRDQFKLPLINPTDKPVPGAIDAARTQILALWVGESSAQWPWAVRQLCEGVQRHAKCRYKCDHRSADFVKMLASHLDQLSVLAGFDPTSTTAAWQALPTHTLRFAEVLAKIYASRFHTDEIFYLFTTGPQSQADRLFPSQGNDDALEYPLNLPDDERHYSLWKLRHRLLEADISDEAVHQWPWNRIETSLREEFGYQASEILAFGKHFFPSALQSAGYSVSAQERRYSSNLPAAQTTPGMWSTPAAGPFQYDAANAVLFFQLPLADHAVIEQLEQVQQLNANEQNAVQDLYFQPRATLAGFAFLFADFAEAQQHLIQQPEEHERWHYFRRQFALCHARSKILAEHLAAHVDFATGQDCPEGIGDAFIVLRALHGDENNPGNWESDPGKPPALPWPGPNGGAFAALLGLTGTGLLMEYTPAGGSVIWRDLSGPLYSFGSERDHINCPLPTVIPSLGLTLTAAQLLNVSILNGIAADGVSGAWLGGAQGFTAKWTGTLLVDHEGVYEFSAGAPTGESERPNMEAAEHSQWLLTLTRDGKTRVVLNHNWPGITGPTVPCPHLKAGAYDIVVEFSEPSPAFATKKEHRLHTGFQVKYMGPDCDDRMMEIPHSRLFRTSKDLQPTQTPTGESYQDLGYGITGLAAGATSYLNTYYSSSLRDIRRTYQRAFKALLFAHRFPLSSKRRADGHSELGFVLANAGNFAGLAYYLSGGAYTQHATYFDFDFLPLVDNYQAPTPAQDSRTQPSPQQSQAMFDWFERLFDYVHARDQVWSEHHCDLWALFDEAVQTNPTNPVGLLRHMGARKRDWQLDLRYYQDQFNPPYSVTSNDLEDDRWVVRAWHADRLVRILLEGSSDHDAALARPDLWASDDPSAVVGIETVTGNANLSTFLCDRCFNYDSPRRYGESRKLNDGLRDRGRCALICYLCAMNRVALPWTSGLFAKVARDLSDLLLLDVEAGLCEKASRIEEAITAVQNFIRRARLGLEPSWPVTRDFAQMWDRHFASFHEWQACKRRHLYQENYIEWEELEKARKIEAFRLLETQLGRDALSIAAPGGLEWWPNQRPLAHAPIEMLQKVEPSTTQLLAQEREGFTLMGTPERDAQPSWLAVVQSAAATLSPSTSSGPASLPFWLESAIRMGQRFWRIAAAGVPPASADCTCATKAKGVCCKECGCKHCPLVDEYYFWLIPGKYYAEPPNPQQNGQAASTPNPDDYQYGFQDDFYSQSEQQSGWQDPTQLPQMLAWNSSPLVRLAWCRVHNGEFQQPRSSSMGVAVQPNTVSDLTFLGRTADSLTFSVSNPFIPSPPPVLNDPSAPGFRYDLVADYAVVLPQVAAPAAAPTYPGNLPSYPHFAYVAPGTHLLPLSYFSPANALARSLRMHCNFEAALKWYRLAFDPLNQDCTWANCPQNSDTQRGRDAIAKRAYSIWEQHNRASGEQAADWVEAEKELAPTEVGTVSSGGTSGTACCDSSKVSPATARNRSIILHFLETLREWGDAAMRKNSPEHFQQARLLFDTMETILGRRPVSLQLPEPAISQTVASYVPDFPPLNPRLMDLYDVARDRLGLIHNCMNASRLRNGDPRYDMSYFGNSRLREGWKSAEDRCCEEMFWCHLHNPYRFTVQIQKAKEFAAKVSQWGSQLLAAHEKGDAEYLASLQANQQREILDLQLTARQDQWRNADWQVEALQKTKSISEANLAYYQLLIQNGLITDEVAYQDLTIASTVLRAAGDVLEGIAGGVELTPNTFTGGAGFGGTPLFYVQLPIGQPLATSFSIAARIMNGLSAIAGSTAGLELTEASWQRRLDEWNHQVTTLTIDIERIEQQILGAQRQRDGNLNDLNVHRRQMEHSAEVLNFLRDKFTAHDLYLYLQKETSDLYFKLYELALQWACSAQACFNLERGHTTRRFIPDCTWNCLQEGLLAGERLETALHHMEKSYLDENVREYELTKHISLRENFPLEYLRLRTTGYCEIDIPDCFFDHDYPGMYMRRIRNVSLTIPCVTGPFNNVNCRLTLLSSVTRIDPRLQPPPHQCCCDRRDLCECELCACDPRAVRQYAAREAIATSSGKSDSGLFEMNFQDERYLPFEYQGAASHWRVELPRENNYFDFDTVSDLILGLSYTAREGGELLRRATSECAKKRLPGDGWCFFDVRHDFPDAWELLRMPAAEGNRRCKQLSLKLIRRMFPYVPGFRDVRIDRITLLFEADKPERPCCEVGDCACLERKPRDSYEVGLVIRPVYEREREHERVESACVSSGDCPDLYVGNFKIESAPLLGEVAVRFEFPPEIEIMPRVYLFCHYGFREPIRCDAEKSDWRPELRAMNQ